MKLAQDRLGPEGSGRLNWARERCTFSQRRWLCWQSAANPSLPAIRQTAGRICQIAGKESPYSSRNPPHLNALDGPLPSLTSRENLSLSREASRADEVFGTHRAEGQLPLIGRPPTCWPGLWRLGNIRCKTVGPHGNPIGTSEFRLEMRGKPNGSESHGE
jgi:hypothetical protein